MTNPFSADDTKTEISTEAEVIVDTNKVYEYFFRTSTIPLSLAQTLSGEICICQ